MRVDELQNGQAVSGRLGRYVETKDHPEWGPWRLIPLYVHRDPSGQVVIITPSDRKDWCEYDPRRDGPYNEPDGGLFECEGYYMQIEELQK